MRYPLQFLARYADTVCMNGTVSVLRVPDAAPLVIVQITQHWTLESGTYYRDCVVQLEDGSRKLVGVRDDLLAAA